MMAAILWIFTLLLATAAAATPKIASPPVPDYKSGNIGLLSSSNQSMPDLEPHNSCRIRTGGRIPTNLGSTIVNGTGDKFLLSSCRECLENIVMKKLSWEFLDRHNRTTINIVCSLYKDAMMSTMACVKMVKQCCVNAEVCCLKQLKQSKQSSTQSCPMTWDGISCIDETQSNHTIPVSCPWFIPNFLPQKFAEKHCLAEGRWLTKTTDNDTWEPTNYDNCISLHFDNEVLLSQIKSAILIFSSVVLIASLSIFILFKSLRSQQRIKIHINLFLAMLMKSIFELSNSVVFGIGIYDRLTVNMVHSRIILHDNEEGCKWLTILLRYFQNTTFFWMLCEAVFLYQLLFRTFEHISNIRIYLFIGWVLPWIYTMIYFFIRRFHPAFVVMDRLCWVEELQHMEYLMRGPNIIVMLVNIILLINILRLIRKLPTQPTDHSWKRTLKAVFVLVPLFGLHSILVVVHIDPANKIYFGYSLVQNLVQDSQGIAVSVAFCVMNQEVINIIKQRFYIGRCTSRLSLPRNHSANRYSNSSRSSDHFKIISIPSQVPMIARHSPNDRLVKERLRRTD